MKYKIKRRKRAIKSWHIIAILILVLISISSSYALYTVQLRINGTAKGEQQDVDVFYININNSSSFPKSVKYMETYSYTFSTPPTLESVRMGGTILTLNTDYFYSNGTLTIPNVTGAIVVEGLSTTNAVAEINGTYYTTLQSAVNAVPKNKIETTINVLKNVSENITTDKNHNIILNLQIYTLSNSGNSAVITNNGILKIPNGTITSDASSNGAINNNGSGAITISGGSVIVTGGRQALYNNNGKATITGDAYLSSVSTIRAAVQNLANGTMEITGGTIISTGSSAVNNAGKLTIGTNDENVHTDSPVMQGIVNGLASTSNFNIYDGIIKGKAGAISDILKVDKTESGYTVVNSEEEINGETYQTAYLELAQMFTITFAPNGGTISESTRELISGKKIGDLPVPLRSGYGFVGWYTAISGGTKISRDTLVTANNTYYAHWSRTIVAEIDEEKFATLHVAVESVATNNTNITVKLLNDVSDNITVVPKQEVTLNLQNYTVTANGTGAVIENNGTIYISNGTLYTSSDRNSAINNNPGSVLNISGGTINAIGGRQAIYNHTGIVQISGNPYITSRSTGVVSTDFSELERSTIQNLANSTLTITGGTIVGETQQAIANEGTLTLGTKDGNIDSTKPVIKGKTHGINNQSTMNFYDGIIKGVEDAISGTVTEQETNSQLVDSTEEIDGETYKTQYLELNS